jgi:hypothetical protein
VRLAVPALAVAVVALVATIGSPASARPYTAPQGKVIVGVTGGRTVDGYAKAAGKRPGVFQFFVEWGNQFGYAFRRAREARTGVMVHVSTYNGPGTKERITPRAIALGQGDEYLLTLGRDFAAYGRPVYLRLLGEMNNAANPYSAYNHDGSSRGPAHAQRFFRQAWRRAYLIVKGGRVATIDARLRRLGMPRLQHVPRRAGVRSHARVRRLPRPEVAVQWAPMTAGSPDIPANRPAAYWPGAAYVDWVGTDFYSRFPNFRGLNRFYADRRYAGKPFVFGEWAMWGRDDPAFMRRFFSWVAGHRRVRMIVYNQGNRTNGPFRLYRYPRAAGVMRRALRSSLYAQQPAPTRHRRFKRRTRGPLHFAVRTAAVPAELLTALSGLTATLRLLTEPASPIVPGADGRPAAPAPTRRDLSRMRA